jgi:hypothetical protein
VGILQRPERIVLLSAPQAFFGLAWGGWVLMVICVALMVTAWITVIQRMVYVYRVTAAEERGAAGRQASAIRPMMGSEGDAYETRARMQDGLALAGDRMVRSADDRSSRLADVAAPGDAVRRTEPGSSGFDSAR